MSYVDIILLALALSVDACIVSFSYGLSYTQNRVKNAFALAFFTSFFQGLMPCIGYYLTSFVKTFISPYTGLIVFVIFMFLGVKFIIDAFKEDKLKPVCISLLCLFVIGVATSIDAFSAGISLSLYGNKIIKPAILITLTTFINSCLGFTLGGKLKSMPTKYIEIIAGAMLIILAFRAVI